MTSVPVLTLSSSTKTLDEDIQNRGGRIAYNGEAGANVVAPSNVIGSNQLELTDLDSVNFDQGSLTVHIEALPDSSASSVTGLRLGVSTFSGVFRVSSAGVISYSPDATFYGSNVMDATGQLLHAPGDPAKSGAVWGPVGQIDSTLNGINGQDWKVVFNSAATPEIVKSLASHVSLVPLDAQGKLTQDWEAVQGQKRVTFVVQDSANGTPVSASRVVDLVAHEETGVATLRFLPVIRSMSEDANNAGLLVAFNGEAGPNVTAAGAVNSNQVVLNDSDSTSYDAGSFTAKVVSGNTAQLRLVISSTSGVFKVNATTGQVTYYQDATYYGSAINGYKTFDPDSPGTAANAIVIGTIDATDRGRPGGALTVHFNDKVTPQIAQTLAAHIALIVTDGTSAASLTQNWSAAAGEKLVQFELKESTNSVAAVASRTVVISSDPRDDGTIFNLDASIQPTLASNEWFDDLYFDSAAATLPGYLGSAGDDARLFNDTDGDALTFKVVSTNKEGWVTSGSIRFVESDASSAGPETWIFTPESSTKSTQLLYASESSTVASAFVFSNEFNGHVPVALTAPSASSPAGLIASFTTSNIVANDGISRVTLSGGLWDTDGNGVADTLKGTLGSEAFSYSVALYDVNADGKADISLLSQPLEQPNTGRVQKDANGAVTGIIGLEDTAPRIQLSSSTKTLDEDIQNRGGRIAYNGEAGANVVAPSNVIGSNQLELTDLDSVNFDQGSLTVHIEALPDSSAGSVTGLRLSVSTLSGVFRVSSAGVISYSPDATFYGSNVMDATGQLLHAPGDPAKSGAVWVPVGQIDSTLNGINGQDWKVVFNSAATPEIVKSLASHVSLVPLDAQGKLTQDWEAVQGQKRVTFVVQDSANGTPVSASRVVDLVAHEETGVATLRFLPVIRSMSEDANNAGLLVAFNGEAGPNVTAAGAVNSNQVVLNDSDSTSYDGGSFTAKVVSGNTAQLRLVISSTSGVFKVNATTGQVTYYQDATYYGSAINGHKTFDPDSPGTAANAIVIGTIDATDRGRPGGALTVHFNDKVTPQIAQTLAAHIALIVTDGTSAASLTQNWSAAAGEKLVQFELKESTNSVAAVASRTVVISSDPRDDGTIFNLDASIQPTLTSNEWFDDLYFDSAAATLPGYLGSAGDDARLFSDTDGDALTFKVVSTNKEGWVTSGSIRFVESDASSAGPETWIFTPESSTKSIQLLYASATSTVASAFVFSNEFNGHVPVALTAPSASSPAGLIASFTTSNIVANDGISRVTLSGGLWDTDGNGVADTLKGTLGSEAFSYFAVLSDVNADGKADILKLSQPFEQPGTGRVQKDANGAVIGIIGMEAAVSSGYDIKASISFWKSGANGDKPNLAGVSISKDLQSGTSTSQAGVTLLSVKDTEGTDDGKMTLAPEASSPSNAKDAITLTDVLAALKIYLGKALPDSYTSPVNFIAADFDANGKVELADVLNLLKYYLGKPNTSTPVWTFVDAADFSSDGKSLAGANSASINKTDTTPHAIDQYFVNGNESIQIIGVLRGDVDGSWSA